MFSCNLLKKWSHPPGSNRRPADYESAALPTELGWPALLILVTCRDFRNRIDQPFRNSQTDLGHWKVAA